MSEPSKEALEKARKAIGPCGFTLLPVGTTCLTKDWQRRCDNCAAVERVAPVIDEARAEEREACARLCLDVNANACAAAIRARKS